MEVCAYRYAGSRMARLAFIKSGYSINLATGAKPLCSRRVRGRVEFLKRKGGLNLVIVFRVRVQGGPEPSIGRLRVSYQ